MLECKDVRPILVEYEAGNLPDEQAGQVADHLLLCPICAAALEDLRRAGDRPVTTAEAPSPAAPRSLGTQDPLAEQKAAPAEEVPAEEQAITDGQVTITAHMMSRNMMYWPFCDGNDANGRRFYGLLDAGCKVKVNHAALPGGSKTSRVLGYEYKLDMPYDTPTYIIGETDAYSRLKKIEKQLTKL